MGNGDAAFYVGAEDARMGRGCVRILHDRASAKGLTEERLFAPYATLGDHSAASLAVSQDSSYLASGAPGSGEVRSSKAETGFFSGYVDIFSRTQNMPLIVDETDARIGSQASLKGWHLHQRLHIQNDAEGVDKRNREYVRFGREVVFSGEELVVSSALSRAVRAGDANTFVNERGTREFVSKSSRKPPATVTAASVRVFTPTTSPRNITTFEYTDILLPRSPQPHLDYGASLHADSNSRFIAVGAPVLESSLYGHGGDGNLFVPRGTTTTLDGNIPLNFKSVEVHGTLTVTRRAGLGSTTGGRLTLQVQQTLRIGADGVVSVDALGYIGGAAAFANQGVSNEARQGESFAGVPEKTALSNYGGGGAGVSTLVGFRRCVYDGSNAMYPSGYVVPTGTSIGEANGGGGGYATPGTSGTAIACGDSGSGGATYGSHFTPDHGSGGGSGHPYSFGNGGGGGAGGGVIYIKARTIHNHGTITANGGNGQNGGYYSGGGGGGSGGSIWIESEQLFNYGNITAVGGVGGLRAADSGSNGNTDGTQGGTGGDGRIKFSCVFTEDVGTTAPTPMISDEIFGGNVHVFERLQNATNNVTDETEWVEHTVRRPSDAHYLGSQVAIDGGVLAFASTRKIAAEFTLDRAVSNISDPFDHYTLNESVYIYSYVNAAGEFLYAQQLPAPSEPNAPPAKNFGSKLRWSNGTLFVSSRGTADTPGVVWIYELEEGGGRVQYALVDWVASETPMPGDAFGSDHLYIPHTEEALHPTLYVLSGGKAASRLEVFRYQFANASVTVSTVVCRDDLIAHYEATQHTADSFIVTVNTTIHCKVYTYDTTGVLRGTAKDLRSLRVSVNTTGEAVNLRWQREGVYGFSVVPTVSGPVGVVVEMANVRLQAKDVLLVVRDEIDVNHAYTRCNISDLVEAGEEVWCTIYTGVGEWGAARGFEVEAVNTEEAVLARSAAELHMLEFPFGAVLKNPRQHARGVYHATPLATEVAWVQPGQYQFSFVTNLAGVHSVYVMYQVCLFFEFHNRTPKSLQGAPIGGTNPVLLQVADEVFSAASSYIDCEPAAAPNRSVSCLVALRGVRGTPRGDSTEREWLTVSLLSGGSLVPGVADLVWGGVGLYRVWFVPQDVAADGFVQVDVLYNSTLLPARVYGRNKVFISHEAEAVHCRSLPSVGSTQSTFKSAAFSRNDPAIWGPSATHFKAYSREFCERWHL